MSEGKWRHIAIDKTHRADRISILLYRWLQLHWADRG